MNHFVKYVTINRMCHSITIFQIPQYINHCVWLSGIHLCLKPCITGMGSFNIHHAAIIFFFFTSTCHVIENPEKLQLHSVFCLIIKRKKIRKYIYRSLVTLFQKEMQIKYCILLYCIVFDTTFLFHSIARFKSHVPTLQFAKFDFFHNIHSY